MRESLVKQLPTVLVAAGAEGNAVAGDTAVRALRSAVGCGLFAHRFFVFFFQERRRHAAIDDRPRQNFVEIKETVGIKGGIDAAFFKRGVFISFYTKFYFSGNAIGIDSKNFVC